VKNLAELGQLVRSARARAQLRIDDAAAVSGVSSDLLSRMERGRPVTTEKLLAVLSSLGLAMLVVDEIAAGRIESNVSADARNGPPVPIRSNSRPTSASTNMRRP
jgi:transcriptional regulator with XRE-family HTH domain